MIFSLYHKIRLVIEEGIGANIRCHILLICDKVAIVFKETFTLYVHRILGLLNKRDESRQATR